MTPIDLLGFLFPPLIDLINRRVTDSQNRFWISVLFCMIAGSGISYLMTGFVDLNDMSTQIMTLFGFAQISYKAIYEKTKLKTTIRKSLPLTNDVGSDRPN